MRPRDRLQRLWRTLWQSSAETVLAIVVVSLLSSVLLGSLLLFFPKGTELIDLYGNLVERHRAGRKIQVVSNAGDEPVVARLSHVRRQVKDRPVDAVMWSSSSEGMPVQHRHAIQTLSRSAATISIDRHDDIALGENSLVVFRQPEPGPAGGRRHATLTVLGGRIRGSVAPERGASESVEIMTANAATRFQSDGDRPADYAVAVQPDNTSVVTLYSGSGEIVAGDNRARLAANQAVTVFPDTTIGAPQRIPATPEPIEPAAAARLEFATTVPDVNFAWQAVDGAAEYRLEIALDTDFERLVYDARHAGTGFAHGNLEPGDYYWRVTAISGVLESRPTPPLRLSLIRDDQAPRLAVELLRDPTDESRLTLRGATEPGARVLVGDADVAVGRTGEFTFVATLRPGVNLITVEAVDAVGNSAWFSEYLNSNASPTRTP